MDKRNQRVQPVRLSPNYFPLDIHKSMFINDLMISIPSYYAKSWGVNVLSSHNKNNRKWNVELSYKSPRDLNCIEKKFDAELTLSFSKRRNQESCYRLKWGKEFASQLAKDYPKSFVRSLEFHIGDEYYKEKQFTEYDIGGFKEQLQVNISWKNGVPKIVIKEFFKIRKESQDFPNMYKELSSYLIADYLLSDDEEMLRRIQVGKWTSRKEITNEINENNIYLLLNRENQELYVGETKKTLLQRYPESQKHHSFDEWTEYCVIQLPPETSDNTRLLIERVLIAAGTKLFINKLNSTDIATVSENSLTLVNKKK